MLLSLRYILRKQFFSDIILLIIVKVEEIQSFYDLLLDSKYLKLLVVRLEFCSKSLFF
jgi:hypothetical protein